MYTTTCALTIIFCCDGVVLVLSNVSNEIACFLTLIWYILFHRYSTIRNCICVSRTKRWLEFVHLQHIIVIVERECICLKIQGKYHRVCRIFGCCLGIDRVMYGYVLVNVEYICPRLHYICGFHASELQYTIPVYSS